MQDKFHVSQYSGEAADKICGQEHKELMAQGNETLKGAQQLWLYKLANFSLEQTGEFSALKDSNVRVERPGGRGIVLAVLGVYQADWSRLEHVYFHAASR